jgi:hypothetical protein
MAIRKHRGAAAADRLMRDALIVELQQDGEAPDGERIAKIRLVARRLIDKAVDGEAAAKPPRSRRSSTASTAAPAPPPRSRRRAGSPMRRRTAAKRDRHRLNRAGRAAQRPSDRGMCPCS